MNCFQNTLNTHYGNEKHSKNMDGCEIKYWNKNYIFVAGNYASERQKNIFKLFTSSALEWNVCALIEMVYIHDT